MSGPSYQFYDLDLDDDLRSRKTHEEGQGWLNLRAGLQLGGLDVPLGTPVTPGTTVTPACIGQHCGGGLHRLLTAVAIGGLRSGAVRDNPLNTAYR